jgi:hypothetical protein
MNGRLPYGELVERLIAAERRARVAEIKAATALANFPRDEISHLAARVVELEDTVEALNRTIANLNDQLTRRTA